MNISFNSQEIAESFLITDQQAKDAIDYSIKEVTASFAREWEKTANQKLITSRNDYVQGLIVVDEGYGQGAVMLRGWLPNAVEGGMSQTDLKEGLLNGPNTKTGKNGKKYNTVPFSHGTPGAAIENFNGGIMPSEIHAIAKAQPVDKPITSEQLPQSYQEVTVSIRGAKPQDFKEYTHKAAIYEGLSKKKDSVTGQNSYTSFRRVSEKSDPNSWIHPGIEARHLAEETLNNFNIPDEVGKGLDAYLSSIGF